MYRVQFESLWLQCPDFTDVFIGREALQGLQALGEIVSYHDAPQMLAKLVVVFIVIAFDRCVLDGSVHSLDLAICPGGIDFGQPVFNFVFIADSVDGHEKIQLSFLGAHVGNIDVTVANGVFPELLLRFVTLHRWQAGDAMTLQTPMQRSACQMWNDRLFLWCENG